jgi:phage tail-like protein
MRPFKVTQTRFDPYKPYRFLVFFGTSTDPVFGVSKATPVKRSTEVIPYKQGGDAMTFKGPGRTTYDSITLERGVTFASEFEDWANAAQVLTKGHPSTSLANLRKPIVRIELHNEAGQPVKRWILYNCWVSEFQAMSDLDAGSNGVAIEHIKIELEGWETDTTLTEPKEI